MSLMFFSRILGNRIFVRQQQNLMFSKKNLVVELPPISKQVLGDEAQIKQLNHQFFLLVRDKKYEQAYALGTMYLQFHPENQAIQQFCYFIKNNRQELLNMVDEELNYTDEESDEEQGDDEDDDQDETQSVASQKSKVSIKNSVKSKSVSSISSNSLKSLKGVNIKPSFGKQNTEICKGHKWDHNCKNKDCPNKKK